jgi:hypothetical protein
MTTQADAEMIAAVAKEAAREAVKELFLTMGLDASTPAGVVKIQQDFAHLRSWRESIDSVRGAALKTTVTVLVTGVLGLLAMVLKFKSGS